MPDPTPTNGIGQAPVASSGMAMATACPLEFVVIANRLRWDMRPLRKVLKAARLGIIEDLILLTFDQGRLQAPIAGDKRALADFLERDDSDFEKYWQEIEDLRIGFREAYAHGYIYWIDPCVEHWLVTKPKTREQLAQEKAKVLNPAGQPELPWEKVDDPKLLRRDVLMEGVEKMRVAIEPEMFTKAELSASRPNGALPPVFGSAENSASQPRLQTVAAARGAEFSASPMPLRSLEASKMAAAALKSSKRYRAISRTGLPEIEEYELLSAPTFRDWQHFVAWCFGLEDKHGQFMGDGNKATWTDSYGGQWWPRYNENRQKFQTVWNETLKMAQEGKITTSIGGTANDLWAQARLGE